MNKQEIINLVLIKNPQFSTGDIERMIQFEVNEYGEDTALEHITKWLTDSSFRLVGSNITPNHLTIYKVAYLFFTRVEIYHEKKRNNI